MFINLTVVANQYGDLTTKSSVIPKFMGGVAIPIIGESCSRALVNLAMHRVGRIRLFRQRLRAWRMVIVP